MVLSASKCSPSLPQHGATYLKWLNENTIIDYSASKFTHEWCSALLLYLHVVVCSLGVAHNKWYCAFVRRALAGCNNLSQMKGKCGGVERKGRSLARSAAAAAERDESLGLALPLRRQFINGPDDKAPFCIQTLMNTDFHWWHLYGLTADSPLGSAAAAAPRAFCFPFAFYQYRQRHTGRSKLVARGENQSNPRCWCFLFCHALPRFHIKLW